MKVRLAYIKDVGVLLDWAIGVTTIGRQRTTFAELLLSIKKARWHKACVRQPQVDPFAGVLPTTD